MDLPIVKPVYFAFVRKKQIDIISEKWYKYICEKMANI